MARQSEANEIQALLDRLVEETTEAFQPIDAQKAEAGLTPTAEAIARWIRAREDSDLSIPVDDVELAAIAALVSAADRVPYFTGPGAAALATFTSFARTLVASSTSAAARSALSLGALATLEAINNGNWSGTDLAVENGGTGASTASGARTNLGLGALAVLSTVNNGEWSGTDLAVSNGGTGASDASGARTNLELAYASTSEQETGTATNRVVAPGTQHRHPSACKCWGQATVSGGTPTLTANFNVTSITDSGVGKLTVTIATDFSAASYSMQGMALRTTDAVWFTVNAQTHNAGSFQLNAWAGSSGGAPALGDPDSWYWCSFGDQ